MQQLYPLKGAVQHYSWGGTTYLPQILGLPNQDGKPFAEYWLGAHPSAPAQVQVGDEWISLSALIEKNKHEVLGNVVADAYESLPYLLKLLDVQHMLSIQVHPSKAVAEMQFEAEEKKGIPRTAPHRNYRDKNHKPELMIALGPFWLLHGFKPADQLKQVFEEVPEFFSLKEIFGAKDYQKLYSHVMQLPQADVDRMLQPLLQRIIPLYESGELPKSSPHFWAARAAQHFCKEGHFDRGIFSIYFFNLLALQKGEGIFQPAGMPHAYLEGQNVEIMAASDNVLRAGLTNKWMDVPELLAQVRFESTVPNILKPSGPETDYPHPAAEFWIQKINLARGEKMQKQTETGETVVVLEGAVELKTSGETLTLGAGEAAFIKAGTKMEISTGKGAELYYAALPAVVN